MSTTATVEVYFEADFRRELEVKQLRTALAVSTFALPGEAPPR